MRDKKEIKECIKLIKDRFKEPGMSDPQNSSVKAGYQKAVEILRKRSTDFKKMEVQYLPSSQAKAIAFIAIDYLNEDAEKEVLLNIPLKK